MKKVKFLMFMMVKMITMTMMMMVKMITMTMMMMVKMITITMMVIVMMVMLQTIMMYTNNTMLVAMILTCFINVQSLCRLVENCKPYNLFSFCQKVKTHFLRVGISKVYGIISVR